MVRYYKKTKQKNFKLLLRFFGVLIFLTGLIVVAYVFFPLISWQLYFAPASQKLAAPIPKTNIITKNTIESLVLEAKNTVKGVDYSNAQNWFPTFKAEKNESKLPSYVLSIPKLGIKNATVSTTDYDLNSHLVNYLGTSIPPDNGNAVIFGHSTLPQLFDPNNYKAIFATAYKLQANDEVFADVSGVLYKYKIFNIIIVDPTDTSIFSQSYDDSYLTLVTCTPPGTTWKRLIIKARLEKI
ncbi:MAG: sortase [Candidatus Levybacteria bacterium]|nr:sortase [Candidatus Levybacteria bacterium]